MFGLAAGKKILPRNSIPSETTENASTFREVKGSM
jgi:hypothetical protein